MEYISKSADAVFPIEIARKLSLKEGTVRPTLRLLLHKGLVLQPYPGAYCDKITWEVRFHPVAIHNIRLHFLTEEVLESWETTENIGGVKVFVHFGSERRKVSGLISYDRGMSRAAAMLAIDRWLAIAETRLGREIKDLVLTSLEVNRDQAGIKLEGGVHCYSKKVLRDVLERVYEKEEGVRHEYRIAKNMTLTEFDQIFNKGLDQVLGVASNLDNQMQLQEVKEAQKFMNRRLLETQDSIRAIERKIVNQVQESEKVRELEGLVQRLSAEVNSLTETNKQLVETLLKLTGPLSGPGAQSPGPAKPAQDYSF